MLDKFLPKCIEKGRWRVKEVLHGPPAAGEIKLVNVDGLQTTNNMCLKFILQPIDYS